ncbi:uroporphyrinogen decarboxylase, chloroplastic-like isoform X1 [Lycium barbarum]|uniref:uroporphyrinogen decarboxylase, chloroplastic-like isoform X1 n=1 Tax=Lycium barbarum TaxID=112863 RepID=UPI00293E9B85|nr:uroporphyrinogen decarboxylase, chloroplastic-like isoform X1 [Lycium barbarum]
MQAGIIPSLFKLSSHSCYSGSGGLLDRLPLTGVDVVSLDWTVDMADGRRQLGPDVAVQGNVDPGVLVAQRNVCRINDTVKKAGKGKHLLNLGHGIKVGTPDENFAHFFEIAEGLREWHYQVLEGQVDRKLHYAGSISHHFQSSPGSGCCHCNLQRRD